MPWVEPENGIMQDKETGTPQGMGRRSFLLLGTVPLLMVGCTAKGAAQLPVAAPGAFPVQIEHVYGATVIDQQPLRIATLGYACADVCMELGVVPVGIPAYVQRNFGPSLWFNKAANDLGVAVPQQYRDNVEIPLGALKALKPDLILAVNSGISRQDYEALSKIAPVVAQPGESFNTDWRTTTTTVGKALGRQKEAAEIIVSVEKDIADALSGYSGFTGTTFNYLAVRAAIGADIEVFPTESNPVRILKDFGLRTSEVLPSIMTQGKIIQEPQSPRTITWESRRAAELVADINVVAIDASELKTIQSNDTLASIPGDGRETVLTVNSLDNALAFVEGSPLGVKWIIWTFMGELARGAYVNHRTDG